MASQLQIVSMVLSCVMCVNGIVAKDKLGRTSSLKYALHYGVQTKNELIMCSIRTQGVFLLAIVTNFTILEPTKKEQKL